MDITLNNYSDYYHLKMQIESEFVLSKSFLELPKLEQQSRLKDCLKKYCQKVYSSLVFPKLFCLCASRYHNFRSILQAYKRVLDKPVTELREAGICMRENSFYVDTVRRLVIWTFLTIKICLFFNWIVTL